MRGILVTLALIFCVLLSVLTMVLVMSGLLVMSTPDTLLIPSWLSGTSLCVVALTSWLGMLPLIDAYWKSLGRFINWLVRRSIMY